MTTKEMKEKVKETANDVKEFVSDNADSIVCCGIIGAAVIGSIVLSKRDMKKWHTLWSKAKDQLDNDNITDFGPYKICRFFEPTGEFMGQLPMHEKTVEGFLNLK